ncbi:MarR family transcriptional regulator [Ornithinimicrobium ciconiae]|uniref:MarR family transcriptional regulator n=1 Tax=Ornithinimicrobium ciconiae TaxID=2594265 RepID=A0A516GEB1_9MICO|nr:MarR family transcriptional regulator [Ornithinimicrobium ciconiae]QDO89856.1 MarR family transcriptional regulator [Ornithinimicrobium ciconiae]
MQDSIPGDPGRAPTAPGQDPADVGEDVRWLSAQEQGAWRAYLRASRLITVALDEGLTEHGTRLTEYEILSMLSEAPGGRLRMSALAQRVVQSRSRLTHTATRLEKLGWVERRAVREDRRGVELILAPKGWEVLKELSAVHVRDVRRVLIDRLDPDEFAALGRAMARIVEAYDVSEEEC